MEKTNQSIFEKAYDPLLQAGIVYGGVVVMIILGNIAKASGLMEVGQRFPWMCAAAFMLFFAMFNSVFALSSKNMPRYWGRSIYGFLGLAFLSGITAFLTSSLGINEAGSYRWIFIVVTIGYLIFLSMITLMRGIVDFAQKEEWNQPRTRRRKGRTDRDRHIK